MAEILPDGLMCNHPAYTIIAEAIRAEDNRVHPGQEIEVTVTDYVMAVAVIRALEADGLRFAENTV